MALFQTLSIINLSSVISATVLLGSLDTYKISVFPAIQTYRAMSVCDCFNGLKYHLMQVWKTFFFFFFAIPEFFQNWRVSIGPIFSFCNFNFRNFKVNEYAPREAFLFTGCWDTDSWAARCPQSTQLSTSAPCLKGHLSNLTFSALTKGFLNIQTSSPPFRVYVFSSICLLLYKPFLTMRSSSVSVDVGGVEGGILSTCNVQ